jgi:hypothetical protein
MLPNVAKFGPLSAVAVAGLDIDGVARLLIHFSEAVDGPQRAESGRPVRARRGVQARGVRDRRFGAIEAFFRQRLADPRRTTRHLWSNLMLMPDGERALRIRVVLTNYAFEPAVSESEVQMRLGP